MSDSFSSQIAGSFVKGFSDHFKDSKKAEQNKADFQLKQGEKIDSSLKNHFSALRIDPDKLGTDEIRALRGNVKKLVDQGMPAHEAVAYSTEEFLRKDKEETNRKKQEEVRKKQEQSYSKAAKEAGGGIVEQYQQGVTERSFMGRLKNAASPEHAKKLIKENPNIAQKIAEELGVATIDLPFMSASMKIFGPAGLGLYSAVTNGAQAWIEAYKNGEIKLNTEGPLETLKHPVESFKKNVKEGFRQGPEYKERWGKTATRTVYDALLGKLLDTIPGMKSAIAKTPVFGKYLDSYAAEQAEKLVLETSAVALTGAAGEARLPTTDDFLHGLAIVAGFKAGGKLTEGARNLIEKARSNVKPQEAAAFDKAFGNLTPEEAQSVSEAKSPEEVSKVVESAMDRLKLREITPETEAGKAGQVAQRTAAPEATGKGKEQPMEKERARAVETVKKAEPESLEKYTEKTRTPEEGQERKSAAGQASEQMRVEELKKQRTRVIDEFKESKDRLEDIDKAIQKNKVEGNKERLNASREFAKKEADKLHQKIKDIEYQMKWGKERPTPESLDEQIKSTFEKMQADIKDPHPKSEKDLQKIENQMKKLAEDLEHANKLIERGELPKVDYEDTYVKVENHYAKAYKDMLEKIGDEIKDIGPSKVKEDINRAKELRDFRDRLKSRLKHNEAKTQLQLDKIRGKHLLKGAKGAFNKQLIKQMRQDVAELQRDYFQHKKVMGNEEVRATKAAKEAIGKLAEEYARNPSDANAEALAQKAGVPKEAVKEVKEVMGDLIKKTKSAEENPTPKNVSSEQVAKKAVESVLKKYLKRGAIASVASSLIAGIAGALIEETFEDKKQAGKIKKGIAFVIRLAGGTGDRGGYGLGKVVADEIRESFDETKSQQYKSSTFHEKQELAKKWQKQYGPARAKRIINAARAA